MQVTQTRLPAFSTYGNYSSDALVFTDGDGRDWYFSYRTLVAVRAPAHGIVVRANVWGPTTGKHLNWIDGGTAAAKSARLGEDAFAARVAEIVRS